MKTFLKFWSILYTFEGFLCFAYNPYRFFSKGGGVLGVFFSEGEDAVLTFQERVEKKNTRRYFGGLFPPLSMDAF